MWCLAPCMRYRDACGLWVFTCCSSLESPGNTCFKSVQVSRENKSLHIEQHARCIRRHIDQGINCILPHSILLWYSMSTIGQHWWRVFDQMYCDSGSNMDYNEPLIHYRTHLWIRKLFSFILSLARQTNFFRYCVCVCAHHGEQTHQCSKGTKVGLSTYHTLFKYLFRHNNVTVVGHWCFQRVCASNSLCDCKKTTVRQAARETLLHGQCWFSLRTSIILWLFPIEMPEFRKPEATAHCI